MYCRTCGSKINDNAEICVKCGVRKMLVQIIVRYVVQELLMIWQIVKNVVLN